MTTGSAKIVNTDGINVSSTPNQSPKDMTTLTEQELTTGSIDTDDEDIHHLVCECNENKAICGSDVSGWEWGENGAECIVCMDLLYIPCPNCGD
jgi:hypothetical protein